MEYKGTYKNRMDDLVDKVANECLLDPDWETITIICDYLNEYPDTCLSTSKMISKRFNYKNPRSTLFALVLTEALMNSCEAIHPIIGGKEFQAEIIKLVQNKKTKEDVRDKALDLAQFWNDSFAFRTDIPLFVRTYQIFVRHGYNFPPNRPDEELLKFGKPKPAAHIQSQTVADRIGSTRPRANSAGRSTSSRDFSSDYNNNNNNNRSAVPRTNNSSSNNREKSEKLDFAALRGTLNLTLELLSFCDPEHDDPSSNDILTDMLNSCKESQATVRASIETGGATDVQMMNDLICLNEDMLKAQEMFDDLVKRRAVFLQHGGRQQTASPTHQQQQQRQPQQQTADLIDFSDFGPSYSQPQQHQHQQHQQHQQQFYPPGPYSHPAPYLPPTSAHFQQEQSFQHQQNQQSYTQQEQPRITPTSAHFQQQQTFQQPQQQSLGGGNFGQNYGQHNESSYPPQHPAPSSNNTNLDYAQYLANFNSQANQNSGGGVNANSSANYHH